MPTTKAQVKHNNDELKQKKVVDLIYYLAFASIWFLLFHTDSLVQMSM